MDDDALMRMTTCARRGAIDEPRDRAFFVALRAALIQIVRAIEVRFDLDSAIITKEQRRRLAELDRAQRRRTFTP